VSPPGAHTITGEETRARRLAIVCILAVSSASASPAHAPSPKAAKVAFGRFLHQLYGGIHGYWTCPYEPPPAALDECLGEVRAERLWHQVGADVSSKFGEIAFDRRLHGRL
jgi:hypothetical protein